MTGYETYRTQARALVRLIRSEAISDAWFFVMIFAAGVAIDGLLYVLAHVVERLSN